MGTNPDCFNLFSQVSVDRVQKERGKQVLASQWKNNLIKCCFPKIYFWLLRTVRLGGKSKMTCNDESQLRKGIYQINFLAVLISVYRQLHL